MLWYEEFIIQYTLRNLTYYFSLFFGEGNYVEVTRYELIGLSR